MTREEKQIVADAYARRDSKFEGANFAGLEYSSEVAGPHGCHVTLWLRPGTTREQLVRARAAARQQRDVVHFSTAKVPPGADEAERFNPQYEGPWIEAIRWIVRYHCARRVHQPSGQLVPNDKAGGVLIDATSAQVMLSVHDALKPDNQRTFARMSIREAHGVAFHLLERCGQ